MNHSDADHHGPGLPLADSGVGHVSMCACGVVTITLHYMSLRFEPAAFRELQHMLSTAQMRLDGDTAMPKQPISKSIDTPPVH